MLESPAHRVLSLSAHRVLNRLEIEHGHHGGVENGNLPTTYEQFMEFGIDRHCVAPAIRELVALGFLEVTEKGRAGNAEFRKPNRFRLTFVHTAKADPTNEWKKVGSIEEAQSIAKAARSKQISNGDIYQVPMGETHTENTPAQWGKPTLLPIVAKPPLLSISRGGKRGAVEQKQAGRASQPTESPNENR